MRTQLVVLVLTLGSVAAHAAPAIPATPAGALNPPAYVPHAMSVDNNLPGDGNLANDAKTLQGVEGAAPVDPAAQSVNRLFNAKDAYIRLNNQLGTDIRNHASSATIKDDREAIAAAKKQLDLDKKACDAEVKAAGGEVAACK